jgi:hypothetical protein
MIKIILEFLPYLLLGVVGNILLGTYNAVITLNHKFSWVIFLQGIWKAFVVSFGFISSSILWDKMFGVVELGGIEISPDILILSVITMYLGKILLQLKDIFAIQQVVQTPIVPIVEDVVIDR